MGSIYRRGRIYWIKYGPYRRVRESSESTDIGVAKALLKRREAKLPQWTAEAIPNAGPNAFALRYQSRTWATLTIKPARLAKLLALLDNSKLTI